MSRPTDSTRCRPAPSGRSSAKRPSGARRCCSPRTTWPRPTALSDRVAFIDDGTILAIDAPETLKLQHGRRAVKVRWRNGDTVEETVIELDGADASDAIRAAVDVENLMTIHTEEATLEDIFVEYAGRGLDA